MLPRQSGQREDRYMHLLGEPDDLESLLANRPSSRTDQLDRLADAPARWIVNVRVSKMGGLIRSLALIEAARSRGVLLIVGAHVGETSLLTRAALTIADHAGARLLAQEGAVGTHLLETDPVQLSAKQGR